ncbi:MAG: hypothetical protein RMY16_11785 [Nostoc sp. DedQUE12b]|uniref:hypothetical protein n=1 Tax=Nostoc sp. DedQUE12b TaxID=3075398 RepID=UPI002AD3E19F|nr:hypothetical protein [Nostoc sp. DedQUE12b]MDZ8086225.1 hypothetical protein [Nostoc sp. DedQUE12b]
MERNKKNSDFQLDISNLIDNAVNNALARRNHNQDLEDGLLTLSNEEMANVAGGFVTVKQFDPIIAGGITGGIGVIKPISDISVIKPIICGLIAQDQNSIS